VGEIRIGLHISVLAAKSEDVAGNAGNTQDAKYTNINAIEG